MKNKKAIEPVVATVLLIVITIVAVALIIAFVVPFIQKQMQGAQLCYGARIEIKADGVCYNYTAQNGTLLIVKIGRGAEEFELNGVVLTVSSTTGITKTVIVSNKTYLPINPLEETSFGVNVSRLFEVGVNPVNITSIGVAPIIKSGTIEKTCEITSQISTIPSCSFEELGDIVEQKMLGEYRTLE